MEWISGNYYDLIWFTVSILSFDLLLVFKSLIITESKIGYYYWSSPYSKTEIELIRSCPKQVFLLGIHSNDLPSKVFKVKVESLLDDWGWKKKYSFVSLSFWISRLLTRCISRQSAQTEDGSAVHTPTGSEHHLPPSTETMPPSKLSRAQTIKKCVYHWLIIFLFVDVKLLWSWYCSSSKIWRSITYMARIGMLLTSGTTLCYWKLCKSGSEEGFVTIKTQWWKLFFHFLNRKTGMIFYNEFAKSRVWCSFSLPCHVFGLCTQGNIHA